jgi:hypothetical protein
MKKLCGPISEVFDMMAKVCRESCGISSANVNIRNIPFKGTFVICV